MMFCAELKNKGVNYTASRAGTRQGLMAILIHSKARALKMIPLNREHTKAIKEPKEDRSKDRSITGHIEMLNSDLIRSTNSLLILVSGLKGTVWIELIRLATMKLAMFGGLRVNSKQKIGCQEITGSISEAV